MYFYKIPIWLHNGFRYRLYQNQIPNVSDGTLEEFYKTDYICNLSEEFESLIDSLSTNYNSYIKETDEINSSEDFKKVYEASRFWQLDKYPSSVYIYGYENKNTVIEYLKSRSSNNKDLDLIDDIENNYYLLKNRSLLINNVENEELNDLLLKSLDIKLKFDFEIKVDEYNYYGICINVNIFVDNANISEQIIFYVENENLKLLFDNVKYFLNQEFIIENYEQITKLNLSNISKCIDKFINELNSIDIESIEIVINLNSSFRYRHSANRWLYF